MADESATVALLSKLAACMGSNVCMPTQYRFVHALAVKPSARWSDENCVFQPLKLNHTINASSAG